MKTLWIFRKNVLQDHILFQWIVLFFASDVPLPFRPNLDNWWWEKLLTEKHQKVDSFTGEEILISIRNQIIPQAKFTYLFLAKTFVKQIKIIEYQGEKRIKAIEKHGK